MTIISRSFDQAHQAYNPVTAVEFEGRTSVHVMSLPGFYDVYPLEHGTWTWHEDGDIVYVDQCAHVDEDDFDRLMMETADGMRLGRSITGREGGLY